MEWFLRISNIHESLTVNYLINEYQMHARKFDVIHETDFTRSVGQGCLHHTFNDLKYAI